MKIKAVIVDDEQIARQVLQGYLEKYCPAVELLGTAEDIRTAVPLIRSARPQLVFLDVEMPYGNAFDVLEACGDQMFETVFVTAYSEYSLKALNRSAAYYLLKPINIEELIVAVNKVKETIDKHEALSRTKILLENLKAKPDRQQLILPTLQGFDVVKTCEIVKLQANGNFTDVFFTDGKRKMVCKFLKHFDDILEKPFIRVHRSHIVNADCIKSFSKSGGGVITLTDGSQIEVSSTYKESLLKELGAGL